MPRTHEARFVNFIDYNRQHASIREVRITLVTESNSNQILSPTYVEQGKHLINYYFLLHGKNSFEALKKIILN